MIGPARLQDPAVLLQSEHGLVPAHALPSLNQGPTQHGRTPAPRPAPTGPAPATEETKRDFLQLLLENDDLAPNILAATSSYEAELMGFALTGSGDWDYHVDDGIEGDTDSEAKNLGLQAGTLRNLVSEAIVQELYDREVTGQEARDELAQKWMTGYEVAKIAATDVAGSGKSNVPGTVANIIMEVAKEDVKNSFVEKSEKQIHDNYADGSSV